MRRKREQEITNKEKEVKEYQKQKFGYEGELFKKKQELIKPIFKIKFSMLLRKWLRIKVTR